MFPKKRYHRVMTSEKSTPAADSKKTTPPAHTDIEPPFSSPPRTDGVDASGTHYSSWYSHIDYDEFKDKWDKDDLGF